MKTWMTFSCLALVVLGMMLLAGCDSGPAVAPVTGLVTQDGEPLAGAMVEFQPDKGAPSYGYTDENGRYEMNYQTDRKGALLGHHYISVRTEGEVTDPKTDMTVNVPESVPAKFNDKTELEYEVVRGKNTFDVKIEGKRKRRGRGRGRRN